MYSNRIDSFTLPGGYQYVKRGLILATRSAAELAGVLAYGIAHAGLRTGRRQSTKGELMQLSSIPAMVFAPYAWAASSMYQGLNLAIPLTFLKFSREAVSAADFYAVRRGISPPSRTRFHHPPTTQHTPTAFITLP